MVFATPASLGNGVTWEISSGTLTIGYTGSGSGVMPTYSSGSDASRPWNGDKASVTNIVVEEGITIIGAYAFHGCTSATTVSLPSTLDSIGYNVFQSLTTSCAATFHGTLEQWCNVGLKDYDSNPFSKGDKKLRTSEGEITKLNIPKGLTKIKPYTFYGLNITEVTIPTSVTIIGGYAFRNCSSLSSVTFTATSTVDSIATYAFGSTALTTIAIPSSVRVIETRAFDACSSLTTIDFNNASKLKTIGTYAFYGTTGLTTLSLRGATSLVTIKNSAFSVSSANTTAKSYLYLPASLRTIEANAFNNRTGLEGIVIMNTNTTDANLTKCAATTCFPAALSGIPVYVNSAAIQTAYSGLTEWSTFTNFTSTNTVTFNCGTPTASSLVASLNIRTGSLTFTGSGDMKDYTSTKADWKLDVYKSVLKSVTISKMSRIGAYAFYNCDNLTGSISIPNTVVSIGNRAFYGCKGLTGLTLSSASKLETIDQYAFYGCSGITSSISATSWGGKVSTLGNYAFSGCGFTKVTPPSTLTSLGNYAFQVNKSLQTADFSASTGLTTFGTWMFAGCSALNNVILPPNLTAIPDRTFSACSSLKTVSIPASVESVSYLTFASSGIKTIIANRATPPTLSATMSSILPDTVRLAVFTSAAKTAYKAHTYWGQFDVDTKVEGTCGAEGDNMTYALDLATGVLTISGSGNMDTYNTSTNRAPWYGYRSLISSVIVEDGVEGIGAYAFKECASMTTISLPASIKSMASSVFDGCSGLTSYSYAGGVNDWVAIRFTSTSSNPMYYVRKCFANDSDDEITELVIPNGVTTIGQYAFYQCSGLTAVTLPASLKSVGSSAFSTCTNIASVNYLGTINDWCWINFASNVCNPAFFSKQLSIGGEEQTDIYLADSLTKINDYAFYDNRALETISIKNTTTINSNALTDCPADIIIRGELTGTCGTDVNWSLEDGVLTISGTGAMTSYSLASNVPWYGIRTAINKLVVEESITKVGKYALQNATNLTSAYLPSTITAMDDYVFNGCTSLAYIVSAATTPPTIPGHQVGQYGNESGTFTSVPTSALIYVPSGSESAYSTASTDPSSASSTGWKRFSTFLPFTGTCGATGYEANVRWTYDPSEQSLTISGTGAMADYASASAMPWNIFKTDITSVTIGNGVTSIGQYAFNGCSNLASVTIAASVSTFKTLSFSGCSNLAMVNYLGTVDQWASCTFGSTTGNPAYYARSLYLNGSLMTECTISVPVKDNTFNYNTALTSVTLADGCTSVGASAFSSCSNLSSVTISSDVASFAGSAFSSCTKLDKAQDGSVNYLGSADQWAAIDFSGSSANPAYYSKSLKLNGSTLTNCTISVDIKPYTFYRNLDLVSLALGANTKVVGGSAFYSCSALEILTCSAATPLDSIAGSAFYDCTALREITLPASLRKVMGSAFYGNNALSSVDFLGTADQWASIYFNGTSSNPASFAQSLKLNDVTLTACTLSVPVGEYAFYNNKSLTSLTLNSGCTSIGSSAFYQCSNIAGTLTIPSTTTAINSSAFRECTSLTGLDLSNATSLQTIGSSAFWQDAAIAGELYIPASVTTVGTGAFNTMSGITTIYAMPATVPTGANQYTFGGFDTSIPFYVTSSAAASNYAAAQYWQDFTNVYYFGYCGAEDGGLNLIWTYNPTSHILTISGSGAMANFANIGSVPWSSFRSDITSINIESGVTTIGNYAFYGCNNASFTSISIPQGVTAIGNSAFNGCTHLASVTLPSTLGSIGSSAFYSNAFTSISIPSSVSTISSYAFKNCTNLGSIVVPNITILNEETFYGCSDLESVTLPSTLTSIKKNAFVNCSSLESITIPEYVTEIVCVQGSGSATCPFSGCTSLTSVVWNARNCSGFSRVGQYQEYAMPFESIKANINSFTFGENVTSIPSYVCHGMTGLTSISIPSSVTSIGANAFEGCTGITSVTSNAVDAPSISSNSFPASVKSSKPLTLVSCESKEDYLEDANWNFTTIYPNKVDFNLKEHGSAVSSQCVEESETPSVPSPAPSETGYTFGGWYDNEECTGEAFDFSSEITEDLTLFAKWTINSYDVTFNLQGHGDAIDAQTIDHNGLVNQPDAPSAEYYTFGGWYKEAGCSNAWDFSEDKVTDDLILYAKWTRADLTLNDNADNSDALMEYDDETTNVHLTRTIISASFNTLCLPFAMTAAQVETYFGAECDIEELTRASYADGDLKLFFTKRTAIEAGKPYLIQPQSNVANPVIADVTIDNTARPIVFEGVTFTGTFSPIVLANSEDLLFLGASNTLYMSSGGTMKGMRGYFQLTTLQAQAAARRSARIVFHEEVATGIETVESQESKVESTKIMRDGQLYILRDGKTYNAQGALIK